MTDHDRRTALVAAANRAYEAAHGNPLPEPVTAIRWRIQPRVGITVVVVVAFLAAGAVFASRPQAQVVPELSATPSSAYQAAVVTVHVAGAVASPGIYELAAGSRVADAIDAAGGATPDAHTESVNLARVLTDGEQVLILTTEAAQAEAETGGNGPVNLNRASAAQLDALPGIGPVLADRIVADRESNGPYSTVQDLERVSGIGPALLEKLAGAATV